MMVESCIPVIPSADLEKSLRFWVPRRRSLQPTNFAEYAPFYAAANIW